MTIPLTDPFMAGVYFPAYDGNGNIAGLLSATDGTLAAQYEYDLFGKTMRATGPAAFTNPFRFSTKYTDDESGLNYYGYRYYNAAVGRWLSKDPIGSKPTQRSSNRFLREQANLYHFVFNKTANAYDVLGLAVNEVQVATFCRKTCGPDYTQAINSEIADFRTYLGGAPEVTGINIITILPWFRDVLASLDYALQADTAALVVSPFTGCPSKDCRGTITLCGKCVGSDVPGNIMFGFAVAAIGIPELLAALGADYAEATDDDGEADMNRISFIIHAALGIPVDEDHDVFPLGKQLFESGSDDICSILNTLPKHATSECSTCSRIGAYTRTKPFRRFPYPMGF